MRRGAGSFFFFERRHGQCRRDSLLEDKWDTLDISRVQFLFLDKPEKAKIEIDKWEWFPLVATYGSVCILRGWMGSE